MLTPVLQRIAPACLFAGTVLGVGALAAAAQPPVAEGMVTPRNPTARAEIVVVQALAGDSAPGEPTVVSAAPRALLVTAHDERSGGGGGRTASHRVGRLEPGNWRLYGLTVDWTAGGGDPSSAAFTEAATFAVGGGEVFPQPLQPRAGQRFRLRIDGSWPNSCVPTILGAAASGGDPGLIVVDTERSEPRCLPVDQAETPWRATVSVSGLAAGRYDIEVRVPDLDPSQPDLVYATTTFRVMPVGAPRIQAIELESDPDRPAHRLRVDVETPPVGGANGCAAWIPVPRTAWVHGRDLHAEFELLAAPTGPSDCIEAGVATHRFPLPEIETGLYRVIVGEREAGGQTGSELWALSPTLIQGQAQSLLLHDRFRVTVDWRDHSGGSGRGFVVETDRGNAGTDVAGDSTSAVFAFFQPENWELSVKVLDACAFNGFYWVFASASTDVEYELTVEDLVTGDRAVYRNEPGTPSPAITDTAALAVCDDAS